MNQQLYPPEGAHIRRFLGLKGSLITEEIRHIGTLQDPSGDSLSIGTIVVTTGDESSFGVSLNLTRQTSVHDSAFLDFAEIADLILALESAPAFPSARDPDNIARMKYVTRDNVRFGITQTVGGMVLSWIGLGHGSDWFVPMEMFARWKDLLRVATAQLRQHGAK